MSVPRTASVNAAPPSVPVSVTVYTSVPVCTTLELPVAASSVAVEVMLSWPDDVSVNGPDPVTVSVIPYPVFDASTTTVTPLVSSAVVVREYDPVLLSVTKKLPVASVPASTKLAPRTPLSVSTYWPAWSLPVWVDWVALSTSTSVNVAAYPQCVFDSTAVDVVPSAPVIVYRW